MKKTASYAGSSRTRAGDELVLSFERAAEAGLPEYIHVSGRPDWGTALAAKTGCVWLLKERRESDRRSDAWTPDVCAAAAHSLDTLKWLRGQNSLGFVCPWDKWTFAHAACSLAGTPTLAWLKSQKCPWDAFAYLYAIQAKNGAAVRWLRKNGCPWDARVCVAAARHSNLPLLKWLRSPERDGGPCPWDEWTAAAAAERGDVPMLRWIRKNGGEWGEWVSAYAESRGHVEALGWLRNNGCPWDGEGVV